ncbi:hypothetical protein [Streptomyces poonensis]|uniref:Secreted protein n=1 Tax=Streptomyces poonensis TaxID=68255 RepID=A0A918PKI2_9ACTN|nr:hypothetical protein [Streptomyces poonensis]GGZ12855.1 hypothetical protein GCM10010365_35710 [Streptomyces poonensis]GLJ91974.1 hypothetical protein GCM10017589_45820 [Streptomyces poonensis]
MTRMHKYVAAAAFTALLAGMPAVSYAVPQGRTAHDTASVSTAAKTPAARIVQPGEHVVAAPGFELWLTEEGKHWTTPDNPDPQFRSVVDGNIDRTQPGVSLQAEGTAEGDIYLSGVYYGGRGTASFVEVETAAGTVRGKLIELPGRPGWGAWYATAHAPGSDWDFVGTVTVRDTKGRVYAQLPR